MMKYSIVPYFEVLFAVIIWGASFIATKVIIVDITFPIYSHSNIEVIKLSYRKLHETKYTACLGARNITSGRAF